MATEITREAGYMHDDQLGDVQTALTGASQYTEAQVGDTGFIIPWLAAGADDYVQQKLQFSHRKALGTAIESIHVHYLLSAQPTAGQTVKLDYKYAWVDFGAAVPALVSWTGDTKTITFTGSEAANTHYVSDIVEDIGPLSGEHNSSILLVKVTRNSAGDGADTYTGNFGLLYMDAHFQTNRLGSANEYTD
ncbi:MAG: hypothetical protein WC455_10050 [Dehalococcoidia bacterium]|jgi:hypothetical protein